MVKGKIHIIDLVLNTGWLFHGEAYRYLFDCEPCYNTD